MQITEAYDTLRQYGYVGDQYSFDRNWLGRKEGYFAYLKSTNRKPSVEALLKLHFKLLEIERRNANYGLPADELRGLATSTLAEIRQRCA